MPRLGLFVVGLMLGIIAIVLLVGATVGDLVGGLGRDVAWAGPYLQVGAIVVGGLGLAAAMVLIGISFGRWRHPVPLQPDDRRDEGLRE